jgi:phosphoribosyl 1,2-cyclic phosphodiesterase
LASDEDFFVQFWGVRGSVPCPGAETARYGGNTSCVEVRCGTRLLILDAGTGLRQLDRALIADRPLDADVYFSHAHLDHICGWPYFTRLLKADSRLNVSAGHLLPGHKIQEVLAGLLCDPFTPVKTGEIRADITYHDFSAGETLEPWPGIRLRTAPLNHPQGATGYRIEYRDSSICYLTDTEHVPGSPDRNILELIAGADLVIYDSTYTDEEFPAHVHWGHSTWQEGVRLCSAAGAKRLVGFHHEPAHNDSVRDGIATDVEQSLPGSIIAREGMILKP